MIYIIVSDIHSNLEAFNAVIDTFPDKKEKKILCCGDIVGYGANPDECVEKIISLNAITVMGNHDAACAGKLDSYYFNPNAQEAVYWTEEFISDKYKDYLKGLPYTYESPAFTLVHGTLHNYNDFIYMNNKDEAKATFNILKTKLCFLGHSHIPGIFEIDGENISYAKGSGEKVFLKTGARYIINVGSVGQPRDGDNRASYCVYDEDEGSILLKRVDYDIKTAQMKIREAGLPRALATRLEAGI